MVRHCLLDMTDKTFRHLFVTARRSELTARLAAEQVAAAGSAAHDFAGSRDLETFGERFPGFCAHVYLGWIEKKRRRERELKGL